MESALLFACKINWLELAQAVVDSARPSDMDMMCSFVVEVQQMCSHVGRILLLYICRMASHVCSLRVPFAMKSWLL